MSYSPLIKRKWHQNEELQGLMKKIMRERKELADWIEKSAKEYGVDVDTYKSILASLASMPARTTGATADTGSAPDETEEFFLDLEGGPESEDDSDSTIYIDADDDMWEFKDMLDNEMAEKRKEKDITRVLVYNIPQSSSYMFSILPEQNKREREEEDDSIAPAGPSKEHASNQGETRPVKRARV